MSTEVARFENPRDGQSTFLRYCGSEHDRRASGSEYRERLQVTLPHNTMTFTCEQAMELARELTATSSGDSDGNDQLPS